MKGRLLPSAGLALTLFASVARGQASPTQAELDAQFKALQANMKQQMQASQARIQAAQTATPNPHITTNTTPPKGPPAPMPPGGTSGTSKSGPGAPTGAPGAGSAPAPTPISGENAQLLAALVRQAGLEALDLNGKSPAEADQQLNAMRAKMLELEAKTVAADVKAKTDHLTALNNAMEQLKRIGLQVPPGIVGAAITANYVKPADILAWNRLATLAGLKSFDLTTKELLNRQQQQVPALMADAATALQKQMTDRQTLLAQQQQAMDQISAMFKKMQEGSVNATNAVKRAP